MVGKQLSCSIASTSLTYPGVSYGYSKVDSAGVVYTRCVTVIGRDSGWVSGLTASVPAGAEGFCSAITNVNGLTGYATVYGPFGNSSACSATWPVL